MRITLEQENIASVKRRFLQVIFRYDFPAVSDSRSQVISQWPVDT